MHDCIQRYHAYEDELIKRFCANPFFAQLSRCTDNDCIAFLLQLGHLSAEFVKWYEQAKLTLENEEAKELIRSILRDEIPAHAPTHQDDRLADLRSIGVAKQRVLSSAPSLLTRSTVRGMYAATRLSEDTHHDLRIIVFLRLFGEVLVGETYALIVRELERRFGLDPRDSRFYAPHARHDSKEECGSHAEQFQRILEPLIVDTETLRIAKQAARHAFNLRYRFYTQCV